jgi:hypothetical protein
LSDYAAQQVTNPGSKSYGIKANAPPAPISTLFAAADCFGHLVDQASEIEVRLFQISAALYGPHPTDGNVHGGKPIETNLPLAETRELPRRNAGPSFPYQGFDRAYSSSNYLTVNLD